MKERLSNKLFKGFAGMLFVIILIASTGLACIYVLKNIANRLVVEYVELEAVQELRLSFNKTVAPAYDYLYSNHEHDFLKFEFYINETYEHIDYCALKLSNRHNKEILDTIKNLFEDFYHRVSEYSYEDYKHNRSNIYTQELEKIIDIVNYELNLIVNETNAEIEEYKVIYKTSSYHSAMAIIGLTIVLTILGLRWGNKFIKQITDPISSLLDSTRIITSGNFNIRTDIKTNDELEELSNSFNQMTETIQETTISRDYFDNILSGMVDSLIITNAEGIIETCNDATKDLIKYDHTELVGKHISTLIKAKKEETEFNFNDLLKDRSQQNIELIFISKENQEIPVLFSFSRLNKDNLNDSKIIIVIHNLRERKKIEEELNQERKKQRVAINEAQEKERLKIATEIHDGLGQMLTGISYTIDNYFIDKFQDDREYHEKINQLNQQIDHTIKESKNIAYDLMPFLLKDFGLITAIENLVRDLEDKSKIKFKFQAFNCKNRFNEKIEKTVYRIIQEALNNVIKHSSASESTIQIIKHDESLGIVIEDNGVGFNTDVDNKRTKPKGIGLISMHERVNSFNGFININSEVNKGTEILIEIPCQT